MRPVRWVLVVVLAGLLTACGSTSGTALPTTSIAATTTTTVASTTTATTATTTTSTSTTVAPTTTVPPATVGARLTLDNRSTVQLLKYGQGRPSAYYTEEAKPRTTLVAVTVEGCVPAGGKATSFNPLYFSLKLPNNRRVDVELGAVDGQINSSDVTPHHCVRGEVGFAIPADTKPTYLYFNELTGTPIRWALPALTVAPTTTTTAPNSPLAVVKAYVAAINAHDFERAWNLGGKNIHSGDYASFVAGFSGTRTDTLTATRTEGSTVHVTLVATQTSGQRQTYQGTYTVSNGVIVSADIVRSG